MRFLIPISILLFSTFSHSTVVTSCDSSLSGFTYTNRSELSDVCYTQFEIGSSGEYHFLKWSAHIDDTSNKILQSVDNWSEALTIVPAAVSGETNWRLPTIKELVKIASFSNINIVDTSPKVLNNYWMLQQWFHKDPVITNAYILSSTYQGGQAGASVKVMAINIATGKVEAVLRDFTIAGSEITAYVLKVKNEEPVWDAWKNKRREGCLSSSNALPGSTGTLITETCPASFSPRSSISQNLRWLYEENTGFVRSYNGQCIYTDDTSNYSEVKISDCSDSNRKRWVRYSLGSELYSFKSERDSNRYFWEDSSDNVDMWNYGSGGVSDNDGKWEKK